MSDIVPFGNDEFRLDFIPDEIDGFLVDATIVAQHLGFREAYDLLRNIPAGEKRSGLARTPNGVQRGYLTEAGFYRALGQRQSARIPDQNTREAVERFQSWVFGEVLPKLRKGELVQAPRELSRLELIDLAREAELGRLAEKAGRKVAEQRVAELEPAAQTWEALANAEGDLTLRDAAQILSRDAGIEIGQKRLAKLLRALGWVDKKTLRPYQSQIANRRLSAVVTEFTDDEGVLHTRYKALITLKGIDALRGHLTGTKPLPMRGSIDEVWGDAS